MNLNLAGSSEAGQALCALLELAMSKRHPIKVQKTLYMMLPPIRDSEFKGYRELVQFGITRSYSVYTQAAMPLILLLLALRNAGLRGRFSFLPRGD